MKKIGIFLTLFFISFFSFSQVQRAATPSKQSDAAATQPGDNNPEKMNRRKMMRELNLTKEQRSKLKEIRQSNMSKKDAITNDDKLTDEQKEAKLRELKRGQAQSTMTILNDEQKAKMKAMRGRRGQN